jgi:predicted PurR-regulated permease PerM
VVGSPGGSAAATSIRSCVGSGSSAARRVKLSWKRIARTNGCWNSPVRSTLATWIVLSILGVPYALALGIVVGFFDLIPLVGATLGAIFVAIATISVHFPIATIVWIAFIIVWQRIEDYVVQPLVYGRAVKVNPIVTILAVLMGASLLGVLGALLAIPVAAAIQIVLRDWWAHRGARSADPIP